jgi:hypothetical protein
MVLVLVIFMLVQQTRADRPHTSDCSATSCNGRHHPSARRGGHAHQPLSVDPVHHQRVVRASVSASVSRSSVFPFALALGSLAAILRFLPYVGPWLALLAPLTLSPGGPSMAGLRPLLILGLFIVIEFTVAFVIEPLLYGRSAGVSAIALLVGAGFLDLALGPIGLALAVPLTVCLVVASTRRRRPRVSSKC